MILNYIDIVPTLKIFYYLLLVFKCLVLSYISNENILTMAVEIILNI